MCQILADYRDAGLSAPLVIYRGWHPGGLSLSYGAGSLAMERGLGTLEELDALRDQVEAENGLFLLEEETVLANTNRLYNTRLDVARTVGQSVMEKATGKELYPTFYYLTPHKSVSMLAAYQTAYGQRFPGLVLSTLPNTLFSYYSGQKRRFAAGEHAALPGGAGKPDRNHPRAAKPFRRLLGPDGYFS